MNLGIDFGSTYSMMSYYDCENDLIKVIQAQNGSPYIPSVACVDYDGRIVTGQAAKDLIHDDPELPAFRAFKMLLTESDPQNLTRMNYDDIHSPRSISKEFLRQQLRLAADRCQVQKFDRVVICAPEIWNREINTMSGKAILKEICMELKEEEKLLNSVTVVSEPAAASAYFAYTYQKKIKEPYNDYLLVVDYGGGTLDISLTKVNAAGGQENASTMEINVVGETGDGENHGKQIGVAGLAYLEGTVRMALKEAGFPEVPADGAFVKTVNQFESALINNAREIHSNMMIDWGDNPENMLEPFEDPIRNRLTTVRYRGRNVPITYALLYRSYMEIIHPVLDEQLRIMQEKYMKNLDPNKLKLALVGGFGQFELVRQQVYDFFQTFRETEDGGREDAVCYGAALIADGVVSLRKIARLSMGIVTKIGGKDSFEYAITKNKLVEYDEIYYLSQNIIFGGKLTSDPQVTWRFAINNGPELDTAYPFTPLQPTQDKLNQLEGEQEYQIGFSVDDSGIYSIHTTQIDPCTGLLRQDRTKKIQLGNFSDIFGSSVSFRGSEPIRKPDVTPQ